jgi:hypothetical protein
MNNEQVLQDFRRRYEGTFIHLELHAEQREVIAYVKAVISHPDRVGILDLDTEEYGTLQLNLGSDGHTLKFKYPPVGVFQHNNHAALFFRRPMRQYRRGLCTDNSVLTSTARLFGTPAIGLSYHSLKSAFLHKTYNTNEALGMIPKTKSVALDDNLTLMCSPFEDKTVGVILHYQQPIAQINVNKGTILVVHEKVYEEMLHKYFR